MYASGVLGLVHVREEWYTCFGVDNNPTWLDRRVWLFTGQAVGARVFALPAQNVSHGKGQ